MTNVTIKPKSNPTTEVLHKIGNWYRHEDGVTLVILAHVQGKAVLITTDGYFWAAPAEFGVVGSMWTITQEQFDTISNGGKKFTLVPRITISEE